MTLAGKLFHQAALDDGIPDNPDFNGANRDGAGYYQFNQDAGVRGELHTCRFRRRFCNRGLGFGVAVLRIMNCWL